MKALIIADDEKNIKKIDLTLKKFGYDTIVYRWLLKALDNIEEIAPHLIVISTEDYPRHWKTLAQFSEGGLIQPPKIILFTGKNFSEDEQNKAKALGVSGTFKNDDFNQMSEFEKILSEISPKSEQIKIETTEEISSSQNVKIEEDSESSQLKEMPCSFIFTNPITLALVSGSARNFNGETLEFTPDIFDFVKNLSEGTSISHATLKISDSVESIKSVKANVVSNDSEKLLLKIIA